MGLRDWLNERSPSFVRFGLGTTYVHTQHGQNLIDRMSSWKYIDRWHDFGVVTFIFCMILSIGALGWIATIVSRNPPEPTEAQDPVNLLAIPGVNEFLPLAATAYIVFALFVVAATHELAHGVAIKAAGIEVEEIGIAFILGLPMAAYVMVEDNVMERISVRNRARIFSAGVFINLVTFAIISVLFLIPGTGNPIDAFLVYFSPVLGEGAAGGMTVADLGIVTNVLFWTWFFAVNLAFLNVLPVYLLDGGQFIQLVLEVVDVEWTQQRIVQNMFIISVSMVTLTLVVVAIFGPVLFG